MDLYIFYGWYFVDKLRSQPLYNKLFEMCENKSKCSHENIQHLINVKVFELPKNVNSFRKYAFMYTPNTYVYKM